MVYNGALIERPATARFFIPKPTEEQSIIVKFNHEPVPSTIQTNFHCDFLVVKEDQSQVSIVVDLPSMKPMSMNLLTFELKDVTSDIKDDDITASETVVEQVEDSNLGKVIENAEIKVEFDWENGSYLPKVIWFK